MVTQGDPATTVTLNGFNFVRKSRVYFNGTSVPYEATSPTQLKVRIDRTFPLSEAAEAHRQLEGRKTTGKVLLTPA